MPEPLLSEPGNRLGIPRWGTIKGDHTAQGTCTPACEFECTSVYMACILKFLSLRRAKQGRHKYSPALIHQEAPSAQSLLPNCSVAPSSLPPTLDTIPARLCLQWKTLLKREGGTPSRKAFSPELLLEPGREWMTRSFTGPARRNVSTTTCSRDIRYHQLPRALQ